MLDCDGWSRSVRLVPRGGRGVEREGKGKGKNGGGGGLRCVRNLNAEHVTKESRGPQGGTDLCCFDRPNVRVRAPAGARRGGDGGDGGRWEILRRLVVLCQLVSWRRA